MPHMKTRGIVLREAAYKESDKILTVLTEDYGRMTIKSQGCRKAQSRLAAASQIMAYSEMVIYEYRDYYRLQEAETLYMFRNMRSDLELLSLGSYFCEAVETVSEEGQTEDGVMPLLLNSLYALSELNKPQDLVKAAFEWKLAALIGYEPEITACEICGKTEPDRPRIHLKSGVLHCEDCREGLEEGISMPLSPEALAALRHIVYGDPKRLFSFRLSAASLKELGNASEAYLQTQLECGFRTLDFYKQMRITGGTA